MFQILVVEDDLDLRDLFCTVLEENGYRAVPAGDGIEAFDIMEKQNIDLVISDIMMPRMDGFELTKTLRETGNTMPVLLITAKENIADKRRGFRSGSDDYMVKPVDVNEMILRVEALLRRSRLTTEHKTRIGDTEFDYDSHTITSCGQQLELPQKEFMLLYKLAVSPNRTFTRRQLLDEIWGPDNEADPHTLDVHISRLRERFKNNPDFDIITIRGLGYKVVNKHD